MKKYRIITNGEKFKAQIRVFIFWEILQISARTISDIVYDSYSDAEIAAVRYLETRKKDEKWHVVERGH